MTYIYPPRATTAIQRSALATLTATTMANWIAQLKYNDTHIMLDYIGPNLHTIWDRHGKHPVYDPRPLHRDLAALGQLLLGAYGPGRHLLDGGLLHSKHSAIKDTIVLWDVLVKNDNRLTGTTYTHRYELLASLARIDPITATPSPYQFAKYPIGIHITDNVFLPKSYALDPAETEPWQGLWDLVAAINRPYQNPLLEGIMLKNPRGVLKYGLREINNNDWLTRSRVHTGRHRF